MPKGVDAGTERTKKRVLAEYKKGTKPGVLAEKFGISVNTIKSWIRRDSTPKKKTGMFLNSPKRVKKLKSPKKGYSKASQPKLTVLEHIFYFADLHRLRTNQVIWFSK